MCIRPRGSSVQQAVGEYEEESSDSEGPSRSSIDTGTQPTDATFTDAPSESSSDDESRPTSDVSESEEEEEAREEEETAPTPPIHPHHRMMARRTPRYSHRTWSFSGRRPFEDKPEWEHQSASTCTARPSSSSC